jgi:putative FmdB family regulatory protein
MPTYEYACSSCQHEWEFEQSIKDAPLTECPACHAATARRQISRGGGFILKGGGWYADLYSSSGNKAATDTKTEAKSDTTTPAKTDTKPSGGSGSSGGGGASGGTSGGTGGGTSGGAGSSAAPAAA